jgi:hypothetical protein
MVKQITYRQLRLALARLGFVEYPVPGGIVFWEEQSKTRLTLPAMPQEDEVLERHLGVARAVITGQGAANNSDFEAALEAAA